MPIDPLQSGHAPHADAARLSGKPSARRSTPLGGAESPSADQASPRIGDHVELSGATRDLIDQARGAEGIPRGTIAATQLQTLLRRWEDGFYDSAPVRDVTADRLRADLQG